jgi:superoxide dismutase, Fe-Mn family
MTDPIQPAGATRRDFVASATLATAAAAVAATTGFPAILEGAAPLTLAPLPWADAALEPVISSKTIGYHYGKHHKGYVDNLNGLVAGTPLEGQPLEAIVKAAAADPAKKGVFNNAAQAWNHAFYWNSLKPKGGKPEGALLQKVEAAFGGWDAFKKELVDAGTTQFGSGWAWLVADAGKLKIVKTANADTPLTTAQTPLLVIDVWEHAYYLDYQNRRKDYLTAVVDGLLNWEFAAKNLAAK